MATEVTAARANIYVEETNYGSGITESLKQKIGGSINFINNRQVHAAYFSLFGEFYGIAGGEAGVHILPVNADVAQISGYIRVAGTSGNTTIDIHYIRSGADQGTIFSTKPVIANTAADGAIFWKNLIDTTDNSPVSGITFPVLSTTEFNQGDALRLDIDGNATGAMDLMIQIDFRPR